jgi:hypothetical protein
VKWKSMCSRRKVFCVRNRLFLSSTAGQSDYMDGRDRIWDLEYARQCWHDQVSFEVVACWLKISSVKQAPIVLSLTRRPVPVQIDNGCLMCFLEFSYSSCRNGALRSLYETSEHQSASYHAQSLPASQLECRHLVYIYMYMHSRCGLFQRAIISMVVSILISALLYHTFIFTTML